MRHFTVRTNWRITSPACGRGRPVGPCVEPGGGRRRLALTGSALAGPGTPVASAAEDGARSLSTGTPGAAARFPQGPCLPPVHTLSVFVPGTAVVTRPPEAFARGPSALPRPNEVSRPQYALPADTFEPSSPFWARFLRARATRRNLGNPRRTMLDISSSLRVDVDHCRRRGITWGFAMLLSNTHRPENRRT